MKGEYPFFLPGLSQSFLALACTPDTFTNLKKKRDCSQSSSLVCGQYSQYVVQMIVDASLFFCVHFNFNFRGKVSPVCNFSFSSQLFMEVVGYAEICRLLWARTV